MTPSADSAQQTKYTAKNVHACFPWISGTTLFNRIKTGKLPVEAEKRARGTGNPYSFDLSGLVHVGVVDEISTLGGWDKGTEVKYTIKWPSKERGTQPRYVDDPSLEEIMHFYWQCRFVVAITVTVEHESTRKGVSLRSKRSERIYWLTFHHMTDPETPSTKVHFGPPSFSSAVIGVWQIFNHVCGRLGLQKEQLFGTKRA